MLETPPSRTSIWHMFDRIAPTYDRLNHLLSFGLDFYWRRSLRPFFPKQEATSLLDCASGTGDQLFTLCKKIPTIQKAIGIDLSEEMLQRAREKAKRYRLKTAISFEKADLMKLPFDGESFDCATMAFGIRNLVDFPLALREIHRTLKPGGRLLILEFSLPSSTFLRALHLFYLRAFLPRLGGWLSKDPAAYRYLAQTIVTFPYGPAFLQTLTACGFVQAQSHPLSQGIVTLYIAEKAWK
jgi:demethylmenaquinone methyltransferase / 2-methoxy-6-polyprenyl-1,4-benzoquinol methylase